MVPLSANALPRISSVVIASHAPEETVYCTVPLTPPITPCIHKRMMLGLIEPKIKLNPPNSPQYIATFKFPCSQSDNLREIIEPNRKAIPTLDSTIPSPLASVKLKIIAGSNTEPKPHKKLPIEKMSTKVNKPFCFFSQM